MIAPVAVGDGNTTVKFPAVDVLSPPKSKAHTALFDAEELYIKAPLAVTVAVPNARAANSQIAVVPEVAGGTLVRALPPEV